MKVFELTPLRIVPLVLLCCFVCLGSPSLHAQGFVFTDFSSTTGLQLNGNAAVATSNGVQVLRITPASTSQVGSAWYCGSACPPGTGTLLPLKNGFSTTFKFQLSGSNTPAYGTADGFAFVIQNGCFFNGDSSTCGSRAIDSISGGSVGYSGNVTCIGAPPCTDGTEGLTQSLAIEFDTYNNPSFDISANEVGIQSCGLGANTADHTSCNFGLVDPSTTGFSPPITLADGTVHTATITYTPLFPCDGCPNLTVTVDGQQVLATTVNLSTLGLDANDDAYVGFTASTGAGDENHDILSWSFDAAQQQMLNGSAQTITFPFDNNTHSIAFTVPAGWCAYAPCTVTAFYTDTPNSLWQTESANYPGTTIAPITALNGDGAVYTVTCTDKFGNICSSPLDYTTTLAWQSSQANFCGSGPALGKEETNTWENILGSCSEDPTISGGSAPRLSRWAAFYGVTGPSSATVTITTPVNGTTYVLGEVVKASYSCSGTYSECAGTVTNGTPIDTSSVGLKTFTAEADVTSGPTATASSSYTVTSAYQFIGFSSPVNNPPDLNIANAGRTIPIKFQVLDASGNPVLNLTSPPVSIQSFQASCNSLDTSVSTTIDTTASGASGFLNLGGGFYQFNWATLKAWAVTCRQLQVNLGDGVLHKADFKFK